jgi:hypothetical protein
LAFHNYESQHGSLPPAAVCGSDGRPLLSWRVLLLPYLEQDDLSKQFKYDEPWDSPHNLQLLDRMPKQYEAPWKKIIDVPPHHTVLHVFVGPGTAFEPGCKLKFADFPDGTSRTLLYIEGGEPVPWTKPEWIEFDPDRPVQVTGLFRSGARSGTVDGAGYKMIANDTDWATLRAAITRNGNEPGPMPWDR